MARLTDEEKSKYAAVKNVNGTNFYYFKKANYIKFK